MRGRGPGRHRSQRHVRLSLLLASSSLAALLVGGGAPPARAACQVVTGNSAGVTNNGITPCINVTSASVTGNISNFGVITPGPTGISVTNSTINGSIADSGNILASSIGIAIDSKSHVNSAGSAGISVTGPSFTGGIANAGSVSGVTGMMISGVTTFGGGITNGGTITANGGLAAIAVVGNSTFTGGVNNTGTISAPDHTGIEVTENVMFAGGTATGGIVNSGSITAAVGVVVSSDRTFTGGVTNAAGGVISAVTRGIILESISTFAGNLSNAGTITAKTGIVVGSLVSFAPGAAIVNSGTLTGTVTAIDLSSATGPVTINQTGGVINGTIKLSANGDVLNISGGAINGNIVASTIELASPATGTSVAFGPPPGNTINFALGAGNTFTYGPGFGFTGITQVNVVSGTAILDGINNALNVAVNGGTLVIGDAANPDATLTSINTVQVAGTLAGHGTLFGAATIDAGGTLAPGGTIGTLTISGGPLTFNSGSFYNIELSPTQHSLTQVTGAPGTVTINGGTVVLSPHLGNYTASTFTILTSTGTITGTFDPTIAYTGSFTLNGASLTYDAHDVFLSYANTFLTLALPTGATVNQTNVATAINNFILAGNTPQGGFQTLGSLSGSSLLAALDQLSGEVGPAFVTSGFQADNLFLALITNPYNFDRNGAFGPAQSFAPEQNRLPDDAALAYAGILKAPPAPAFTPHWSTWGAAYGGGGPVGGTPVTIGAHGANDEAYGYAGGFDYRWSQFTTTGLALGGGGTGWSLAQGLGSGRSDVFNAGLYGSTRTGPLYVTGALADSVYWVDTTRTVTVAGSDALTGRFDANVYSARLETGYRFDFAGAGFTPYAAGQGEWMHMPSYAESATAGLAQFALTYAAQNPRDARVEVGAWFDRTIQLDRLAQLQLYARAAFVADSGGYPSATAGFQTLPGTSFVVYGAKSDPDSALLTGGIKYVLGNGWSFLGKADGDFARNASFYSGSGTVRYAW